PAAYFRAHAREHKRPLRQYLLRRGFSRAFVDRRKVGFSFPIRYLLAPSLGAIRGGIRARADLLGDVGVRGDATESPLASFRSFSRPWSHFVLAEYLARVSRAPGNVS